MLPYVKHLQDGASSSPVSPIKRESDTEQEYDALESAAEELINAIHSKDVKAVTSALRAAFDLVKE